MGPWLIVDFPDPGVRFLPALGNCGRRYLGCLPAAGVQPVVPRGGSQQEQGLAERVELELPVDPVPDKIEAARVPGQVQPSLIGYPAAYFVSRFAGRRKGMFLLLLIAPFWISYMMRMLAWIDLLQTNGYVNKVWSFIGLGSPNWLGGHSYTVILGLVYGYIPYLILVLYAGLDRINPSLLEAGRDLGLSRAATFWRVTLPLSRQPILTGMLITVLPMLGDYYTNTLLSGAPSTAMIGNVIDGQLTEPFAAGQGAILSMIVLLVLIGPMIYYVVATNRTSQAAS